MRSLMADRSGAPADSRGADLTIVDGGGELFRLRALAGEIGAQGGERFLQAVDARGLRRIGRGGHGLGVFDSRPAMRAARSSTAAALTAGAAGAAGASPGHPEQPRRRRAPAPPRRRPTAPGSRPTTSRISAPPEPTTVSAARRPRIRQTRVSPEISVASRSMVGGARRARPGSGGSFDLVRACPRPSHGSLSAAAGAYRIRPRPSSAITGRNARSNAPNRAFSSGDAATTTWVAPASRTTAATASEMQHCGERKAPRFRRRRSAPPPGRRARCAANNAAPPRSGWRRRPRRFRAADPIPATSGRWFG